MINYHIKAPCRIIMKSITFLYKILGFFFLFVFIYFVLYKNVVMQSFVKKAEIVTNKPEETSFLKTIEIPITIIEGNKLPETTAKITKSSTYTKLVMDSSLDKKKRIRKRISTKYKFSENKPLSEQLAINNEIEKQEKLEEKKTNNEVVFNNYVTIIHNITQEMLTYHHWTGNHAPTTFAISIDGVPLKMGESVNVFYDERNEIMIRYDYSFLRGYKTGSREIYFSLPKNKENLLLTFSWHTPGHLILDDAEIVRDVVVPFNKLLEK